MEPQRPQKVDPIGFTLGLLAFLMIYVVTFVPSIPTHSMLHYTLQVASSLLKGLFILYMSVKRFRQTKDEQEQKRWYLQPGILLGLGLLLFAPSSAINLFTSQSMMMNTLPSFVETVFLALSIPCILAAGFLYVRGYIVKR